MEKIDNQTVIESLNLIEIESEIENIKIINEENSQMINFNIRELYKPLGELIKDKL